MSRRRECSGPYSWQRPRGADPGSGHEDLTAGGEVDYRYGDIVLIYPSPETPGMMDRDPEGR